MRISFNVFMQIQMMFYFPQGWRMLSLHHIWAPGCSSGENMTVLESIQEDWGSNFWVSMIVNVLVIVCLDRVL